MNNPLIMKLSAATDLTRDDRAILTEMTSRTRRVERKTDLISEGDRPEDVQLVLDGLACRYKVLPNGDRHIMAVLLPGDFCDLHVAILGEMDHSIATLAPCTIVEIPRETIEDLTRNRPRITRALWWATLVDEAILREWLVGLGQRQTDRQMAHLFCELFTRLHTVGLVDGCSFDLPITQEELGDMLGVSIVHTNRMLMQLRDDGLVTFDRKRVVIHDLERLKAFAGFQPNYLHLRRDRSADEPYSVRA